MTNLGWLMTPNFMNESVERGGLDTQILLARKGKTET